MGRAIDTNLKLSDMGYQEYDSNVLKALVKTNPLVILDNIPGKSHYPLFDKESFDDNKTPLLIRKSWQMGGGGVSPDFFSFFLDSKSSLYLPTLVLSGIIGNSAFELAKRIFAIFKEKLPRKRQTLIYFSEKEETTYYELPSETSTQEFNEGIQDIPKTADRAKPQSYFVRSLKTKSWILEDKS